MAPKFQELSQKYLDVVFLKLDCNQENKPLAKELGIKVVPTFKILKDSKVAIWQIGAVRAVNEPSFVEKCMFKLGSSRKIKNSSLA
ncbi:hypothetical protein SO802_017730 [Lithocarpus litseifolius]|uniref:Thioredoxin domain-containing protein n=1 Tax=Lithocarpus litseifolius TaxID=425828 RepID=A0AAW2CJ20_9ROSI